MNLKSIEEKLCVPFHNCRLGEVWCLLLLRWTIECRADACRSKQTRTKEPLLFPHTLHTFQTIEIEYWSPRLKKNLILKRCHPASLLVVVVAQALAAEPGLLPRNSRASATSNFNFNFNTSQQPRGILFRNDNLPLKLETEERIFFSERARDLARNSDWSFRKRRLDLDAKALDRILLWIGRERELKGRLRGGLDLDLDLVLAGEAV